MSLHEMYNGLNLMTAIIIIMIIIVIVLLISNAISVANIISYKNTISCSSCKSKDLPQEINAENFGTNMNKTQANTNKVLLVEQPQKLVQIQSLPSQPNTGVISENTPSVAPSQNANKLVLYYTEWCGYSRSFFPEWEILKNSINSSNLNNLILMEKYDCDVSQSICDSNGVNGFPTIILHKANGLSIPYKGARNAGAILAFLKMNL